MKVFVIMGNDFPDAVRCSKEEAEKYVEKMKKEHPGQFAKIYWRVYEFDMPIVHPPMSEAEEWLVMEANCR